MRQEQPARRRLPPLAWLLVAGAALHLAVWAWVNWYRIFGPYLILKLEDLSSIVTGVAPFLLGAAALAGADRWPDGRRWLVAGAVVAGLLGLAHLAFSAWWAWLTSTDIMPTDGAFPVVSVLLGLAAAVAAALVPLGLALGLARAPLRRPLTVPLLLVPLLVGVGAVAGSVWILLRELAASTQFDAGQQGTYVLLGVAHRVMAIVGDVGFAALAVAALRAMPRPIGMPELVIALGALLVVATRAMSSITQAVLSIEAQNDAVLWVFTVPFVVEAAGYVLLVIGFGLAAAVAPPPNAEPGPRPAARMGTLAG